MNRRNEVVKTQQGSANLHSANTYVRKVRGRAVQMLNGSALPTAHQLAKLLRSKARCAIATPWRAEPTTPPSKAVNSTFLRPMKSLRILVGGS